VTKLHNPNATVQDYMVGILIGLASLVIRRRRGLHHL
jgi:hypothetical protein